MVGRSIDRSIDVPESEGRALTLSLVCLAPLCRSSCACSKFHVPRVDTSVRRCSHIQQKWRSESVALSGLEGFKPGDFFCHSGSALVDHISYPSCLGNARLLHSLASQSLARLGAEVTGIDPSAENVAVASGHSKGDPLTRGIKYEALTATELEARGALCRTDRGCQVPSESVWGETRESKGR